MDESKTQAAVDALNRIMEFELAGVVKYTRSWPGSKAMPTRVWPMPIRRVGG